MRIPFDKPFVTGKEIEYLQDAIATTHLSGGGPYTKKCQELLANTLGVGTVLLTTSCTHALEMSALLLDIQPGDEVIVPSFSFVSTANAFVLRGARPVFVDIRPDTANMDESLVEDLITTRTKAIVPVHYGGIGCEMDALIEIADRNGVALVEDNAHGLYGFYKGRPLGTFGDLATLSFHDTKNFTCGEGGALLINDPRFAARAEIISEKGTDRGRFFRGEVDKYSWVDVGSSYLPSELLAAYLYAQLESREDIQRRRQRLWDRYREGLGNWAESNDVQLPSVPEECQPAHHMFYLLLPDLRRRQAFITHLMAQDVVSVFHYVPLHTSSFGRPFCDGNTSCPVTEDISERLVRLPLFNALTEVAQDRVIEAVLTFDR